ncbi:branched-chain amino acid ABC transporter permease/ATP-binding protein [Aeromicrobium wangtongii]|uniref:branched-chain amino acid ABC transporter permease/ATP-binding protein n=1 Tax=Aeromicrobium wangtongii TaxID=2969247 RepID=UPI002017D9C0|nr:branched-chain amino acid ABC transporter permease/ATP-binding protein [Aeromicrobium wangtongii]MCL3818609.1 branched-chain amino acid ABC transporter permease/ATP-binding protein [Aeromicrobium wangtongii]
MEEFIRFALLGLGVGSLYALASQGLIVIYRGSGVLNFGLGAIGMVAAYAEFELMTERGWPFLPAVLVGVAISAAIGLLCHLLIMRPLRTASPLARIVATLGILITLQAIIVLRYGSNPLFVPVELPQQVWTIHGDITISSDRVIVASTAVILSVVLWAVYRFTKLGLATSAVAENQRAASSLGLSPDVVAGANWAIGSALAGLAAILIAPIVTLQAAVLTNVVMAALAAALLASFRSFSVALVGGLLIGVAETLTQRYVNVSGIGKSVPFIVIVLVVVLRGQALPLRDFFLQRLPAIGTGRINWPWVGIGTAATVVLLSVMSAPWQNALIISLCATLILLSIVVVTGYAGQLSLAQFAFAGIGAFIAGRVAAVYDTPFWLAAVIGVVATVPIGVLFALPAVRTRGLNLAVVTFGMGAAVELIVFNNPKYTGGIEGTEVGAATLFGWEIDSIAHPARYGFVVLACVLTATLVVANVRRSRSGRRLIAARTNERAAAALGISVAGAKLYAFALSSALAALGGILLAFMLPTIQYQNFTSLASLNYVGIATVGGLGYLMGPILASPLAPGALGQQVLDSISSGTGKYLPLITGLSIIVLVLANQDGIAKESASQIAWIKRKLGLGRAKRTRAGSSVEPPAALTVDPVAPRTLHVDDLTVTYGGTTAVCEVSLSVRPGSIVGLIGPNGAGKTSFIDAVTGFTKASSGRLRLDDVDISGWSAVRRARAGMGRSFQSLELFEDSTVMENLRTASDPRDRFSYFRDLFAPVNPPLPAAALVATREFGFSDKTDRYVASLSYADRRLLAIARAVASEPSVLMLDEPAAGLGQVESAELASLVRRLADEWGMGILLVEHDMDFVMSVCDEIVVLDFGQKISEGRPETVRHDAAVIAAYLGSSEPDDEPVDEPVARRSVVADATRDAR